MLKITRISFGGTAAIVTSMALMAGLESANAAKATEVSALLIAAVADNLTDSLSVHLYQESEGLERREAFVGTLANFATRLMVCISFVLMVLLFERRTAAVGGVVWGLSRAAGGRTTRALAALGHAAQSRTDAPKRSDISSSDGG